jgi:hypothetical protein
LSDSALQTESVLVPLVNDVRGRKSLAFLMIAETVKLHKILPWYTAQIFEYLHQSNFKVKNFGLQATQRLLGGFGYGMEHVTHTERVAIAPQITAS